MESGGKDISAIWVYRGVPTESCANLISYTTESVFYTSSGKVHGLSSNYFPEVKKQLTDF